MQRIFYSINIKFQDVISIWTDILGTDRLYKNCLYSDSSTSGPWGTNQNLLYAMVVRLVKWWSPHPDSGFFTVKKGVHKLNMNDQSAMKKRTPHIHCISKSVVSRLREVIIPFCLAFGLHCCGLTGASPKKVQGRHGHTGESSLEGNWNEEGAGTWGVPSAVFVLCWD